MKQFFYLVLFWIAGFVAGLAVTTLLFGVQLLVDFIRDGNFWSRLWKKLTPRIFKSMTCRHTWYVSVQEIPPLPKGCSGAVYFPEGRGECIKCKKKIKVTVV